MTRVGKTELLVLSIQLVLSEDTRGRFGTSELGALRPSAILVHTSRGPIVDALGEQTISAAGLDVYDQEPLPVDDPLLSLENCVLSPHLGDVSEAALRNMYERALEDSRAFLAGHPLRQVE